ncbi:DNA helicase [Tanacetum coccineum]
MRLNNENLSEVDKHKRTTFAQWLLDIGDGQIGIPDDSDLDNTSWVDIPDEYCIPNDDNGIPNLINFIYDADTLHYPSVEKLQEKAIICPKNDTTDMINNTILSLLTTPTRTYLSYDDDIPHTHDGGEIELLYPKEYLNSRSFPGLPPHSLTLKVGSPIILMATSSYPDTIAASKGKMIAIELEVTNIKSLKPTDSNKTIEVIMYRKWVSKYVHTRQSIRFCCMLIDKQGTPIQANMDAKDTYYFDQLLQLHNAYRITGFSCEQTCPWERTLDNLVPLTFGKFITLQQIPNADFPEHYFNFAAYNELPPKVNAKNPVLAGDGSGTISLTCFSNEANSLVKDCSELLNELPDKNPYQLPSTLKELEDIQASQSTPPQIKNLSETHKGNQPSDPIRRSARKTLFKDAPETEPSQVSKKAKHDK